jgi:predicted nucleic acid-binding protein
MGKVYIETSIVSYLTASPSRDLVRAAHQEVTTEWWAGRSGFELYISQFVLDEASAGDPAAAAKRLDALRGISLLDVTKDATLLAGKLLGSGALPANARIDAFHVAVATAHGMDYLLTWNYTHIANAAIRVKSKRSAGRVASNLQ